MDRKELGEIVAGMIRQIGEQSTRSMSPSEREELARATAILADVLQKCCILGK